MASRFRSISKPAFSFLNYSAKTSRISSPPAKSCAHSPFSRQQLSLFFYFSPRFPAPFYVLYNLLRHLFRVSPNLSSLQSLLPLHSAVSSARLTSRLAIGCAFSSKALYQGTLCISIPGV
ncbi:hypothetical protein KSP40_PGU013280 [Platanthera guangdongensis]|uniref:Uncharacterized protein n=1 Tax=Platanthera guangdongensis TaxID=2320717 RepID=A0ABR2N3M6_9ASPA